MKTLIQSAFAGIFGLITKEDVAEQVKHAKFIGRTEKAQEDEDDRERIKILCIEIDIGKPFISVSNEWQDPVIGIVLGVEFVTLGKCPIAKVYDFVTDQVVYCGNSRIPYSEYNLDAILKLEPYQRWNLVARSNIDPNKRTDDETCSSPEQIKEILKNNSFYEVLPELEAIHHTTTKIRTETLIDLVYGILNSKLLNTR